MSTSYENQILFQENLKAQFIEAHKSQVISSSKITFKDGCQLLNLLKSKNIKFKSDRIIRSYEYGERFNSEPPDYFPEYKVRRRIWNGTVSFKWKGTSVSVLMYCTETDWDREGQISLFATDDEKIMAEILFELEKFNLAIYKNILDVYADDPIIKIPQSWDNIILDENLKLDIKNSVDSFFTGKEDFKKYHIAYKRGFLFSGPPGNGKTLTIRTICSNSDKYSLIYPVSENLSSDDFNDAFRKAVSRAPSILVLEDLDRLTEVGGVSLSHILNTMDGVETTEGVLIIATSNHPEKLDSALLCRPSRFDRTWKFDDPEYPERLKLLQLKGQKYFSTDVLERLAEETEQFSMAYLQELTTSAFLLAAKNKREPQDSDLDESFKVLKKQLHKAKKELGEVKTPVGFGRFPNMDRER